MVCEVCGYDKKNVKIRSSPMAPYFNNSYFLCEDCFKSKEIPYNDLIEIISLYETYEEIPFEVKVVLENSLQGHLGSEILSMFYKIKNKIEEYNNFIKSNGGNKNESN